MPLAIFDLDNTLVDRAAAFAQWALQFCREHNLGNVSDRVIELDNDGFGGKAAFIAALRSEFNLDDPEEAILMAYRRDYPPHIVLEPATRLALSTLRSQGWKIGIATNGSAAQLDKITNVGLLELIDGYSISEVDGHRKPDPAIFQLVAHRCSADLETAWMIGDNPTADIGGGHALGMSTMWLHRGRDWPEREFRPTHQANTIVSAINLLMAEYPSNASSG